MWLRRTAVLGAAVALLAGATAFAASSITKATFGTKQIPAGQTRTVTVPYADALKYGNARYSGSVEIKPPLPFVSGTAPDLAKVKILSKGSVLGGSEYQVRAHNGNAPGTAPVRLEVTTTTVEPLPHS
jgi:hypothetical protein